MKKAIIDYLQITTEEYNELIFQYYWNWCFKYASTPNITQQLLANALVNKWFMIELHKVELQFMKTAQNLPNKKHVLEPVFYGLLVQVFNIYPKPLIEGLKKNSEYKTQIKNYVVYGN